LTDKTHRRELAVRLRAALGTRAAHAQQQQRAVAAPRAHERDRALGQGDRLALELALEAAQPVARVLEVEDRAVGVGDAQLALAAAAAVAFAAALKHAHLRRSGGRRRKCARRASSDRRYRDRRSRDAIGTTAATRLVPALNVFCGRCGRDKGTQRLTRAERRIGGEFNAGSRSLARLVVRALYYFFEPNARTQKLERPT